MQTYQMTVHRLDSLRAESRIRDFTLMTGVRRADPTAGLNAVETLLSSLGTCLLTNVNTLIEQMHLKISEARVELTAVRQDDPPLVTSIRYQLVLVSPEPRVRLETVFKLAQKWGTVSNTLARAVTLEAELITVPSEVAENEL
ncbi:MAG: OsmC family protein [Anaerolineae bacterium]